MIPLRYILIGAAAIALVVGVPILVSRYNESLREEGRAEIREEVRVASEEQATRIRELQRLVETRQTQTAAVRDRFITRTVTEVRYAAQPLAACPVPEPLRLRLNAAASCARDDSAAACELGLAVPVAR